MPNSRIATIPGGLLGLFGIKNEGEYPSLLASFYQPTLDMLAWLAGAQGRELQSELTAAFNTVGTKPGAAALTLVPPGQVFLVHGANANLTTTATDFADGACVVTRTFGAQRQIIRASDRQQSAITGVAAVGGLIGVLEGPFLMFPGDQIELDVRRIITAGTITGAVACVFTRFAL